MSTADTTRREGGEENSLNPRSGNEENDSLDEKGLDTGSGQEEHDSLNEKGSDEGEENLKEESEAQDAREEELNWAMEPRVESIRMQLYQLAIEHDLTIRSEGYERIGEVAKELAKTQLIAEWNLLMYLVRQMRKRDKAEAAQAKVTEARADEVGALIAQASDQNAGVTESANL